MTDPRVDLSHPAFDMAAAWPASRSSDPRGTVGVDHHEPQLGLRGHGIAHLGEAVDTGRVGFDLSAEDFQPELIAGNDRPAELDTVERGDQDDSARPQSTLAAIKTPAACARASTMSTPGMIGCPGQWPRKNGSLTLTFLMATALRPGSSSSTLSTSRNG